MVKALAENQSDQKKDEINHNTSRFRYETLTEEVIIKEENEGELISDVISSAQPTMNSKNITEPSRPPVLNWAIEAESETPTKDKAARKQISPPNESQVTSTQDEKSARHRLQTKSNIKSQAEIPKKPVSISLKSVSNSRLKCPEKSGQKQNCSKGKSFQCTVCSRSFITKSYLNRHLKLHSNDKPFKCSFCFASFKQKSYLESHKRRHTGERPFACHICHLKFAHDSGLSYHLKSHVGERLFQCDNCPSKFLRISQLKVHLRSHTGERPFQCENCPSKFAYKSHLKRHLLLHTGERPFKCNICPSRFTQKSNLGKHLRSHTGKGPFQCNNCPSKFIHKGDLKRHLISHTGERPFKCNICPSGFKWKSDLSIHLRSHTGERPFQCENCPSKFAYKSHLNRHLTLHTGERPFECNNCPSKFTQKSDLTRHLMSHTGERPFKCNICPSGFARKSDLSIHLRSHTGERPFQCANCPSKFSRKSVLKLHLRSHTGERPFQCANCPSKFSRKSVLKIHLLSHTGERPFKCNICPSRFTHKSNLNSHLRSHTGERPFQCNNCPSKFAQKGTLKRHLISHTGERLFKCNICPSRFKEKSKLNLHLRLHTGERLFTCHTCDSKFLCKRNLRNHVRLHLDNEPFEVPQYSKTFKVTKYLQEHLKRHLIKKLAVGKTEKVASGESVWPVLSSKTEKMRNELSQNIIRSNQSCDRTTPDVLSGQNEHSSIRQKLSRNCDLVSRNNLSHLKSAHVKLKRLTLPSDQLSAAKSALLKSSVKNLPLPQNYSAKQTQPTNAQSRSPKVPSESLPNELLHTKLSRLESLLAESSLPSSLSAMKDTGSPKDQTVNSLVETPVFTIKKENLDELSPLVEQSKLPYFIENQTLSQSAELNRKSNELVPVNECLPLSRRLFMEPVSPAKSFSLIETIPLEHQKTTQKSYQVSHVDKSLSSPQSQQVNKKSGQISPGEKCSPSPETPSIDPLLPVRSSDKKLQPPKKRKVAQEAGEVSSDKLRLDKDNPPPPKIRKGNPNSEQILEDESSSSHEKQNFSQNCDKLVLVKFSLLKSLLLRSSTLRSLTAENPSLQNQGVNSTVESPTIPINEENKDKQLPEVQESKSSLLQDPQLLQSTQTAQKSAQILSVNQQLEPPETCTGPISDVNALSSELSLDETPPLCTTQNSSQPGRVPPLKLTLVTENTLSPKVWKIKSESTQSSPLDKCSSPSETLSFNGTLPAKALLLDEGLLSSESPTSTEKFEKQSGKRTQKSAQAMCAADENASQKTAKATVNEKDRLKYKKAIKKAVQIPTATSTADGKEFAKHKKTSKKTIQISTAKATAESVKYGEAIGKSFKVSLAMSTANKKESAKHSMNTQKSVEISSAMSQMVRKKSSKLNNGLGKSVQIASTVSSTNNGDSAKPKKASLKSSEMASIPFVDEKELSKPLGTDKSSPYAMSPVSPIEFSPEAHYPTQKTGQVFPTVSLNENAALPKIEKVTLNSDPVSILVPVDGKVTLLKTQETTSNQIVNDAPLLKSKFSHKSSQISSSTLINENACLLKTQNVTQKPDRAVNKNVRGINPLKATQKFDQLVDATVLTTQKTIKNFHSESVNENLIMRKTQKTTQKVDKTPALIPINKDAPFFRTKKAAQKSGKDTLVVSTSDENSPPPKSRNASQKMDQTEEAAQKSGKDALVVPTSNENPLPSESRNASQKMDQTKKAARKSGALVISTSDENSLLAELQNGSQKMDQSSTKVSSPDEKLQSVRNRKATERFGQFSFVLSPASNKKSLKSRNISRKSNRHSSSKSPALDEKQMSETSKSHQKTDQASHVKSPLPRKAFVCSHCGANFKRSIQLKTHLQTHVSQTPFACKFCGAVFYQMSSVLRHQKLHIK